MDLNFAKAHRAAVDFEEWDLSESASMMDAALKSAVGAALDVVFSENGAEIELQANPCADDSGDVLLRVGVDLGGTHYYATSEVSLKSVLVECAAHAPEWCVRGIASGLRKIAEELDRAHEKTY